jgi:hypothetical protein
MAQFIQGILVPELKVQRMMRRDAVKGVKFYQLIEWDKIFDKWMNVTIEFPQINVDASYDPIEKFFQGLHNICRQILLIDNILLFQ